MKVWRIILIASFAALCACTKQQSVPTDGLNLSLPPQTAVVQLAKAAQICWFKSKDKAFAKYRLANETNSHVGKPRFLLVPRNKPTGLPLLVVQGEARGSATSGKYTHIDAFGPLLQTSHANRIQQDLYRWSKGSVKC